MRSVCYYHHYFSDEEKEPQRGGPSDSVSVGLLLGLCSY